MKRHLLAFLLISSFSAGSFAGTSSEIDIDQITNQTDLANLVKDLGAALSYKAISPAENLGLIGFDVGVEVSRTSMETDALQKATVADAPSDLIVPKIHAHIGIPFIGIDLGAFVTSIPDSNMSVFAGEIKYSLVDGNTVMPAFSIRGTFSNLSGVDNFKLNTKGLELSVSKGFLMFTPYATIGIIRVTGKSDVNALSEEREDLNKLAFGVNLNLGLINFDLETDKTGDNSTTSLKVGFRF